MRCGRRAPRSGTSHGALPDVSWSAPGPRCARASGRGRGSEAGLGPRIGRRSAAGRLSVGRRSAVCRLPIGCRSAACRLPVGCPRTSHPRSKCEKLAHAAASRVQPPLRPDRGPQTARSWASAQLLASTRRSGPSTPPLREVAGAGPPARDHAPVHAGAWSDRTASRGVVRHGDGTTWQRFWPRGWDHLLARYGTTSTVPGPRTSSVRVRRVNGERVAYREITVIEIKEVLPLVPRLRRICAARSCQRGGLTLWCRASRRRPAVAVVR